VGAAWYSSMLLFMVSITAACCYWADMKHALRPVKKAINIGWLLIAAAFATLSFDEMGSFHESIGDSAFFKQMGKGVVSGWGLFYIFGGLVASFMVAFFLIKFKGNKKVLLFSILGFLLLLSNPFQEKYEHYTWDNSPDPLHWQRPIFMLLMEEGSELLASLCFFYSFLMYAVSSCAKNNVESVERNLDLNLLPKRNFVFGLAGLCCFLVVFMLIILKNAWHMKLDDTGRPQNWFPSMIAFALFLISLYSYFENKKAGDQTSGLLLSFALVSLLTSAYFGADIYNYSEGLFSKIPIAILIFTVTTGIYAVVKLPGIISKLFVILWFSFIVAAKFTKEFFFPPLFALVAFFFLMLGLFYHAKFLNNNKKPEQPT